ncbi:MAG: hypothetical protein AB1758_29630, partial [Candidatus Eremiobacterota bacterium]
MKISYGLLSVALALNLAAPLWAEPSSSTGVDTPGIVRGFNPQPDPPGSGARPTHPGTIKGFNPQPEPPGYQSG